MRFSNFIRQNIERGLFTQCVHLCCYEQTAAVLFNDSATQKHDLCDLCNEFGRNRDNKGKHIIWMWHDEKHTCNLTCQSCHRVLGAPARFGGQRWGRDCKDSIPVSSCVPPSTFRSLLSWHATCQLKALNARGPLLLRRALHCSLLLDCAREGYAIHGAFLSSFPATS